MEFADLEAETQQAWLLDLQTRWQASPSEEERTALLTQARTALQEAPDQVIAAVTTAWPEVGESAVAVQIEDIVIDIGPQASETLVPQQNPTDQSASSEQTVGEQTSWLWSLAEQLANLASELIAEQGALVDQDDQNAGQTLQEAIAHLQHVTNGPIGLPQEIWFQILSYLPAEDQTALALTTSQLQQLIGIVQLPRAPGSTYPLRTVYTQERLHQLLDDPNIEELHLRPGRSSALSLTRPQVNGRPVNLYGPDPLAEVSGTARVNAWEGAVITLVSGGRVAARRNARIIEMTNGEVAAYDDVEITVRGGKVVVAGQARIHVAEPTFWSGIVGSPELVITGHDRGPIPPLATITGPDGGPVTARAQIAPQIALHTPTTQAELDALLDDATLTELHVRFPEGTPLRLNRPPINDTVIHLYGSVRLAEVRAGKIWVYDDLELTTMSGGHVVIWGGPFTISEMTGGRVVVTVSGTGTISARGGHISAASDQVRIRASGDVRITGAGNGPVPETVTITGPGGDGDPVPDTVTIRR